MIWFRLFTAVVFCLIATFAYAGKNDREYYKLVVYQFKNASQEKTLDNYLAKALLPALASSKSIIPTLPGGTGLYTLFVGRKGLRRHSLTTSLKHY